MSFLFEKRFGLTKWSLPIFIGPLCQNCVRLILIFKGKFFDQEDKCILKFFGIFPGAPFYEEPSFKQWSGAFAPFAPPPNPVLL